jgi:pyruvate ferredoxin oxidoreductase gamma subunit
MSLKEIRWHARGGQGAKTVATFLAECAIEEGLYSQGFPEYGPERMGAPMRGFTRISDQPINLHSPIIEPEAVVVLDDTLLGDEITDGVKDNSVILVNTVKTVPEVRQILKLKGSRIFTIDATKISIDEIGRPIPNMPMLGALLKILSVVKKETVINSIEKKFQKKFKESVILGNIKAIERALKEVQAE